MPALTPISKAARQCAERIYPIAGQMYENLGLQLCDRATRDQCRKETIEECAALIQQALTAESQKAVEERDRKLDSLRLEIAACEHHRLKDNEYLLSELAALKALLKEAEGAMEKIYHCHLIYILPDNRSDLVAVQYTYKDLCEMARQTLSKLREAQK